jgi:hypothetical protein
MVGDVFLVHEFEVFAAFQIAFAVVADHASFAALRPCRGSRRCGIEAVHAFCRPIVQNFTPPPRSNSSGGYLMAMCMPKVFR